MRDVRKRGLARMCGSVGLGTDSAPELIMARTPVGMRHKMVLFPRRVVVIALLGVIELGAY